MMRLLGFILFVVAGCVVLSTLKQQERYSDIKPVCQPGSAYVYRLGVCLNGASAPIYKP